MSGFLINALCMGSALTVGVIALDRYFAIIHCLRYSSWSRKKYGGILLSAIWFLTLLFSIPPAFGIWGDISYQNNKFLCLIFPGTYETFPVMSVLIGVLVPIVVMTFCYARIIRIARQHAKRIFDISAQSTSENQCHVSPNGAIAAAMMYPIRRLSMLSFPSANINLELSNGVEMDFHSSHSTKGAANDSYFHIHRETKALVRLIALIVAFCVCWVPHMCSYIMFVHSYGKGRINSATLETLSVWLVAMHSCLNPFLYAIISCRFRTALTSLFETPTRRHQSKTGDGDRRPSAGTYAAMLQNRRNSQISRSGDYPVVGLHGGMSTLSIIALDNCDIASSESINCPSSSRFLEVPDHAHGHQCYENSVVDNKSSTPRNTKRHKREPGIAVIPIEGNLPNALYSPIEIKVDLIVD